MPKNKIIVQVLKILVDSVVNHLLTRFDAVDALFKVAVEVRFQMELRDGLATLGQANRHLLDDFFRIVNINRAQLTQHLILFMDQKKTKDQATQCEVLQREYISARIQSTFFHESEAWGLFYRSRNITLLLLLLTSLYLSSNYLQGTTFQQNAYYGYVVAFLTFCCYAASYLPNPLVQRPHPVFWRLLQGWACAYLATIVFLLHLTPDQVQSVFRDYIDPQLGRPLPQKSYAEDCRVYTPENQISQFYNIYSSIDVFFLAHVCGWTVKMWILRDFKLAMLQQVVFEFMEITFRHWLPNFWECWWDHLILDVLLCNTGGILLGWYTMRIFQMKEYRWSLRKENNLGYWENFKRLCITPQLDVLEWKVFSSVKRFLSVVWFMVFMNLCDLSYFFNKYILNIPIAHGMMKFRVFPIGFYSIVAARDYYVYISDENVTRLGPNAFLIHMIVLTEWLLFFKNENGKFTESFPWYVKASWSVIFVLFVASIMWIVRNNKKVKSQ